MKNKPLKKIALFGGSFDPVHTDHLNMAKSCYADLGFDEVWMIPTFLSPFKTTTYTSDYHRLAMLSLITRNADFIKIVTYEIDNNQSTPTIKTVKHLIKKYPEYVFSFVIGTDNLARLEEWNNFYELANLISFTIFKRSENYSQELITKYGWSVHEFENNHLSSTNIRKLKQIDKQDRLVKNYINNHLLYLNKRLEPFMDQARYQHCLNVGLAAQALAIKHDVDSNQAKIAGTLHDVTKRWDEAKQKKYLEKYNPKLLSEPVPVWHAYTGALHLKYDWLIEDQAIIQAVHNHTVGSPNMSKLDMIIFCADKISSERDYSQVEEFRQACFANLEQGFKMLLKNQYDQAVKQFSPKTIGEGLKITIQKYLQGEEPWN